MTDHSEPPFDSRTLTPDEETTSRIIEMKNAVGLPLDRPHPMSPGEVHRVDDLQDRVMAGNSPDGRPPRHDLRIAEWKWLFLGIGVVLTGLLIWAIAQGMAPVWIVIFGLLWLLMLGIAISPVLYAGMLRGGEERDARRVAAAVVKDKAALHNPLPNR